MNIKNTEKSCSKESWLTFFKGSYLNKFQETELNIFPCNANLHTVKSLWEFLSLLISPAVLLTYLWSNILYNMFPFLLTLKHSY